MLETFCLSMQYLIQPRVDTPSPVFLCYQHIALPSHSGYSVQFSTERLIPGYPGVCNVVYTRLTKRHSHGLDLPELCVVSVTMVFRDRFAVEARPCSQEKPETPKPQCAQTSQAQKPSTPSSFSIPEAKLTLNSLLALNQRHTHTHRA